jgi:hypothetical protein
MALLMPREFGGSATLHFWHRSGPVCDATGISKKIQATKSGSAVWIA